MEDLTPAARLQLLIRQKESELEFWQKQLTSNVGPNLTFIRLQYENANASLVGLQLAFKVMMGENNA